MPPSSGNVLHVQGRVLPGTDGVLGQGVNGVHGIAGAGSGEAEPTGVGVYGESDVGTAVYGVSKAGNAVQGNTASATRSGVTGVNSNGGPAVSGQSSGNAGEFHGNVLCTGSCTVQGNHSVTGNLTVSGDILLPNQDCAEDFEIAEAGIDRGTVVVIDENGTLQGCRKAYDQKVAGVISGAGDLRPAIILGRGDSRASSMPVALVGKVYCKVDAGYSPVKVGDLLTTSATAGHAMRAADPDRAFGAVIGKALRGLEAGQGLIPILIALQ
jgi:hypothetical protein